MLWQHNCHAMCKIMQQLLYQNLDEKKLNFLLNFGGVGGIVSEMGAWI